MRHLKVIAGVIACWIAVSLVVYSVFAVAQTNVIGGGVYGDVKKAGGGGGVSIDVTGTKVHQNAATSFSSTAVITVGSGNALVVVANFGYSGSAPTSVSATWNSVAMTTLSNIDGTGGINNRSSYVFGLRSPASGAKTLAITWTNSAEIFVDAMSFSGVNVTSNGTAFPSSNSAQGSIATVAITSNTGDYVVSNEAQNANSPTLTGTTLYNDSSSGQFINCAANYMTGSSGTVNIGYSTTQSATIAATDVAH